MKIFTNRHRKFAIERIERIVCKHDWQVFGWQSALAAFSAVCRHRGGSNVWLIAHVRELHVTLACNSFCVARKAHIQTVLCC